MDRRIKSVAIGLLCCFLALAGATTYWGYLRAPELLAHTANKRGLLLIERYERGNILAADGSVVARSVGSAGGFARTYPLGPAAAHIIGYAHPRLGKSGVEAAADAWLTPVPADFFRADNTPPRGADVRTTIDARLQAAAHAALTRPGAIVCLDPQTGAVLAMASYPSFDPNSLAQTWDTLNTDPLTPLVNRASQGRYPPGSVFKIVTLAAYLDDHGGALSDTFDAPAVLPVGGFRITNFGDRAYGTVDGRTAFVRSINTVFAQMGLIVGVPAFVARAESLGFNTETPFDLPTARSTYPPSDVDDVELAWRAVGQGKTIATPLGIALVTAAVANGGAIPRPHVVETVTDDRGAVLFRFQPSVRSAISATAAVDIGSAMRDVVAQGTGRRAQLPGVTVAGKTGTAEVETGAPHAWFTAYAPLDAPRIVVTVIIEHGESGGSAAAPIAADLIRTYLEGR